MEMQIEEMCYLDEVQPHQEMYFPIADQSFSKHVIESQVVQPKVTENKMIEETPEIEQPLYKLSNIDTEATIKTEIKQLILTNISVDINSKILSDAADEVENQISLLKNKNEILQSKIKQLDKEVEMDKDRLQQSEATLQKTNEMIELLKENVEKLIVQHKESRMVELTKRSLRQHENFEYLKKIKLDKFENANQTIKDVEIAANKKNDSFKADLRKKEEMLKGLKNKENEYKKMVVSEVSVIEKYFTKKCALQEKFNFIINENITVKTELMKKKDSLPKSYLIQENQIERLKVLEQTEIEEQKELNSVSDGVNELKISLSILEEKILEKEHNLKQIQNQLESVKKDFQNTLEHLQKDYKENKLRLNEILAQLKERDSNNEQLLSDVITTKSKFTEICDLKSVLINKNANQRLALESLKMDYLIKQNNNDVEYTKLEELKTQYEAYVAFFNSKVNEVCGKQEKASYELMQLKSKFEETQAINNKKIQEMKKKKEYLLTNSKFLEEKSENLRHEAIEIENSTKNLQEENISLKLLIEKKKPDLETCKNKLHVLKGTTGQIQTLLKSKLKSPNKENVIKKVKFNDILSYKSATSSEASNLPVDSVSQLLETSFQEWLDEVKSLPNNLGNASSK